MEHTFRKFIFFNVVGPYTIHSEYHKNIELNEIQCVDDLYQSLRDYLDDVDIDLNIQNIVTYYNINSVDELDDNFDVSYDDDDDMDLKIETIDKCTRLILMDEPEGMC